MSEGLVLTGFGVKGYRCFDNDDWSYVGPMNKIHLITGRNNAGKSTLSDYCLWALTTLISTRGPVAQINGNSNEVNPLKELPYHGSLGFSLCFDLKSILHTVEEYSVMYFDQKNIVEKLETELHKPNYSHNQNSFLWIDMICEKSGTSYSCNYSKQQFGSPSTDIWKYLCEKKLSHYSSDNFSNYQDVLNLILPWSQIPQTIKIPAIRSTSLLPGTSEEAGSGITKRLLRLQNPKSSERAQSDPKLTRLHRFIQTVLEDDDADFSVDAEATEISIKTKDSGYLPLSSVGTGIEELLILAMTIATYEHTLIFIEEPEIHLHPALQRKLVEYLNQDETNQFLITTHSQALINTSGITVTHVQKKDGVSRAHSIKDLVEARALLDDLGARASDILQSNFVIWVEGPSDRIYINYWISQVAPDIKEGISYSVMIYGGKLLNALDANVESSSDLIKLFHLNTHFCVLMDSDKNCSDSPLNATKERIIDECRNSIALAWITAGSTIENYVPAQQLKEAITESHPGKTYSHELGDQWTTPLSFTFENSKLKPNKIAIARSVVKNGYDLDSQFDLKERVSELIERIRSANAS